VLRNLSVGRKLCAGSGATVVPAAACPGASLATFASTASSLQALARAGEAAT